MARFSRLVKPAVQDALHLKVLRTERLSSHWMRITLGEGDIADFVPLGYDQWFRLFLPVSGEAGLERVPAKAGRIFGYLKYLRIPDGMRPVMRNYTVRAFRTEGPSGGRELDIDFVLHGSGPEAGPASRWAESCTPGESVVIIDEGLGFNPDRGTSRVLLVADETGLPAVAGVCASLPEDAIGVAILEVPSEEDALTFRYPSGIEIQWVVREDGAAPGVAALEVLTNATVPEEPVHAFVVGEQALATGGRRHLVNDRGLDKDAISFVGYWRIGTASPTPKSVAAAKHD